MTVPSRPRLLIFVVAYQAEATLRSVLERIPRQVLTELECEILVVDDASEDRTYHIGHAYRSAHPDLPLTVLRNTYNPGYGGNQKVGYSYALEEGYDLVAMIHGDGQYAPESLPALLEPLLEGRADAVLGSRMMTTFGALRGGMPLYKYFGNRILTAAQNALLGTRLSEFHSGYRVYSTRALRTTRFTINSNDFHFDTEIIIQLLNAGQRIVELPIPTYYGDEISRVNGLRYARDVTVATGQNACTGRACSTSAGSTRWPPRTTTTTSSSSATPPVISWRWTPCLAGAPCSTSARARVGWRPRSWSAGAR